MDRALVAVIVALLMVMATHFAGGAFDRLLPWHVHGGIWYAVLAVLGSVVGMFIFHGLLQHKLTKWLREYFKRRDRDDYVRNFQRFARDAQPDYMESHETSGCKRIA